MIVVWAFLMCVLTMIAATAAMFVSPADALVVLASALVAAGILTLVMRPWEA